MNINPPSPFPRRDDAAVRVLLDLMADRHGALRRHSEAVARLSVAMAAALGLAPHRHAQIRRAALLHDVGKLAVPDAIIEKPGPLSGEEYEIVRRHPVWGHRIVHGIGLAREAIWVLHHHERPDGLGYPDGLRDREIPVEASILHVADAFDALVTDRPYRAAMTHADALAVIARGAEAEFDAACAAALVTALTGAPLPGAVTPCGRR